MLDETDTRPRRAQAQGDYKPFREIDGEVKSGFLLLCDHAENTLPEEYGTLGLGAGELERHIAYDIGVAGLCEQLARGLKAPAVLTRFSRLLIDPNRGLDDPTLIMKLSDGAIVPGNRTLDEAERARRIETYHQPYHRAITRRINAAIDAGHPPALIAIHSFTPAWRGRARPWHAGILWDKDPRLALPLIEALRCDPDLVVGDNEPYSGRLKGDCLYTHGTMMGLANVLLEIRQDLISEPQGIAEWAERLAGILSRLGGELPGLKRIEHFGSHTDDPGAGGLGATGISGERSHG